MHILGKMQEAMGEAKAEVSQFAPRLYTMKINPEKIRDVIGKGGATIRALTEETGTTIDIGEDGTLTPRWTKTQNHASHMILLAESGVVITGDHSRDRMIDQVVAIDISTGDELVRADTESPLQAVVFPALGYDGTVYWCSMSTVSRVRFI